MSEKKIMERILKSTHAKDPTSNLATRLVKLTKEDRREVRKHLRKQKRELSEISLTAQDVQDIEKQVQQGIEELREKGLSLDS